MNGLNALSNMVEKLPCKLRWIYSGAVPLVPAPDLAWIAGASASMLSAARRGFTLKQPSFRQSLQC